MNYFDLSYSTIHYDSTHTSIDKIKEQNTKINSKINVNFYYSYTECNMSGTVYRFGTFYNSQNAKETLVYPISFSILKGNKEYFTKRENMNCYELRFTMSGSGTLRYHNKTYELKPGDGYLIDNRELHYYQSGPEGWTSSVLHLNGALVRSIYSKFIENGSCTFHSHFFPNFEMYQYEIIRTMQSITQYREYQVSCLFDRMLTELLTNSSHPSLAISSSPNFIQSVTEYINEHYADLGSVNTLCGQFYVSREHLSREFSKYLGLSPKEYITHVRIHHAKILLKSTDLSLSEISYQIGYSDQSYFTKIFKRLEMITPLQYRKNRLF